MAKGGKLAPSALDTGGVVCFFAKNLRVLQPVFRHQLPGWLKGLLASRIFIPPEVCLQVRSPACVRLWFC